MLQSKNLAHTEHVNIIIVLQKDKDYVNHLGLPQLHDPCPMTVVIMACLIRKCDQMTNSGMTTLKFLSNWVSEG